MSAPGGQVEGDRSASSVPSKRKWLAGTKPKLAIAGVGGLVLAGMYFINPPTRTKPEPADSTAHIIGSTLPPPTVPIDQPPPPAPVIAPTPVVAKPPDIMAARAPLPQPHNPISAVHEDKRPYSLTYEVTDRKTDTGAAAGSHAPPAQTEVAFKPTTIPGAKAGKAMDWSLIMKPQLIPCKLDNAIDSTLAGPIMCHTARDVLSPTKVVLMEQNTLVMGSYKSDVQTGQSRLLTMSGYALTPAGVPVPLDGPVADGLGRAGTTGDVDNHVVQRFGGAVMLALTGSALQIIQSAMSGGNNQTFNFGGGADTSGINQIATQVLRSSINIPPTITVPQGTVIGIWITYPISFQDTYGLRSSP